MRDPALWTSWYVVLLLFPFMIIILLVRDFIAGRRRHWKNCRPFGER